MMTTRSQEEDRGVVDQRSSDPQPLSHPTAEGADTRVSPITQPERLEQAGRASARLLAIEAEQPSVEAQTLRGALGPRIATALGQDADAAANRHRIGQRGSGDRRRAIDRIEHRGERPDHGGLPGSVRSEQPDHLTSRRSEAHSIDCGELAVLHAEGVALDPARWCW
jgi:hypothetical protein